jgi:large subunit ribosomal protein L10
MARPEKVAQVQAIAEKLKNAKSIVMADYTGLKVEQMTAFRAICRGKGVECRVVKNRLAKIAASEAALEVLHDYLRGPTAFVLAAESQVEPAKVVVEFAKENEALKVKGGIVDGRYLAPDRIIALSTIPSREELLAKIMGSIQSPVTGVALAVRGVSGALVRAIDAVAKQKAA